MRICFFGHREFYRTPQIEEELSLILRQITGKSDCEFFFGGYSGFDDLAYRCVNSISSPNKIKKLFVTPYITEDYQKNVLTYKKYMYDGIIYPEIERTPYRYAISARNKWIIDNCDSVICYINHSYGGAFAAVKRAKNSKKTIINLGKLDI